MNDLHQIDPQPGARLGCALVAVIIGLAVIVYAALTWGQ